MRKLHRAFVRLVSEIEAAREFPDAHTDAAREFDLTDSQADALTTMYDQYTSDPNRPPVLDWLGRQG